MATIIEFLRARLEEDEGTARGEITRREVWQRKLDQMRRVGEMIGVGLVDFDGPGAPGDPARVLAEVEAKRRILERAEFVDNHGPALDHARAMDMTVGASGAFRDVLRFLALPYTNHPDYDPAWAPEQAAT